MTDDQHGDEYGDEYGDQHDGRHEGRYVGSPPPSGGRWDPLPQGDYDDGATAFVKLPEGGVDALLASSDSPLAAPGHGYVPPQITVTSATTAGTDPAATGSWAMPSAPSAPVDGTQWQAPEAGQESAAHQGYDEYAAHQDPYGGAAPYGANAGQDDRFAYQPGATGQWDFPHAPHASHDSHASQGETDAAAAPPAPGQDVTGQWSIPVAGGDLPDESGEFTTSSLAEQWGTGAPATLPGGAPAPWATQPAGQPWGEGPGERGPDVDERSHEDRRAPAPRPAGQPWGDAATQSVPGSEERPAGGPHASGSAEGRHGPGSAGGPHAPGSGRGPHASGSGRGPHAPGSGRGPHAPGSGRGPHAPGPADGVHGPGSAEGGHEPGSGRGPHTPGSGRGPHTPGPDGGPYASDSAEGLYAPGPVEGLRGSDSADGLHTPGPADGVHASGPADGVHAPGAAAVPHLSDSAAGTAGTASGPVRPAETVTDEPVGAEEAPEGPAERPAGPAAEAMGGSRPEAAEGHATGPAPTAGPERAPEPAREHGREAGGGPQPGAPAGPRGAAADVSDPADARTDPADAEADAADTRTDPDETRPDPADPEASPAAEEPPAPVGPQEEHPLASYVLRVNGADRPVTDAWIGESLLYVLRERLGLAGAKDGCSQGECGACNVQVDGRLVASCLVPSVTAAGSEVRTVEGLAADGRPSDVQRALARRGAVQCGFCVPGMAMTVHNLLEGNPAPTELEARQALCGNLCRCSGYRGVLEAVREVVAEREAHADDAQAGTDSDEPRIPHQAGPGAGGVNPSAFEPQPPPDTAGPHGRPPYGDHGNHGQDGGHA
ncbi:2Fe-2S iron-sulfur cluster-binding protein [Streptomyces sp. MMCC 100]|uniref:2Fe-2S iron-sulfur cluster-binding protein n=1 Tax=Streptomyces sp. MMCC 100 TaxID=3163555 RepID=UPI003599FC64